MNLSQREKIILTSIVKHHIKYGEPIGSKFIADILGVSSATVRNDMAQLGNFGLLEQPHTSAGRIPSQLGYREYLNSLMIPYDLSNEEKLKINLKLSAGTYDIHELLTRAITSITPGFTTFATTPGTKDTMIRAVQFVQISRRSAMLIIMSSAGTIKNRIFRCEYDLTPDILRIFFRIFNEKFAGVCFYEITPAYIQNIWVSLGEVSMLVTEALHCLTEVVRDTMSSEPIICGQMNLMFHKEFDIDNLKTMLKFLENGNYVNTLLNNPLHKNVLLGSEIKRSEFSRAGIILSNYSVDSNDAGVLAIIGPIRMDYPKLISQIKYISQSVSTILTSLIREEH